MRSILRLTPFLILLAPRMAGASNPTSIYSVPSKVQIFPDDATGNRVVLSGAFFFLNGPTGTYGAPRCGYMSFECPAGQGVMCRMQWQDIRRAIGQNYCAGFGTWGMMTNATLHADLSSGVKPDAWELGMGVSPGIYVDGKCGPALKLVCAAPPPPDSGAAPDSGPPTPPPPPDSAVSAPDASEPGSVSPDAPFAPDTAAPAAADAAVTAQPAKPSACSFGGTGGLFPLALALLALVRRARR